MAKPISYKKKLLKYPDGGLLTEDPYKKYYNIQQPKSLAESPAWRAYTYAKGPSYSPIHSKNYESVAPYTRFDDVTGFNYIVDPQTGQPFGELNMEGDNQFNLIRFLVNPYTGQDQTKDLGYKKDMSWENPFPQTENIDEQKGNIFKDLYTQNLIKYKGDRDAAYNASTTFMKNRIEPLFEGAWYDYNKNPNIPYEDKLRINPNMSSMSVDPKYTKKAIDDDLMRKHINKVAQEHGYENLEKYLGKNYQEEVRKSPEYKQEFDKAFSALQDYYIKYKGYNPNKAKEEVYQGLYNDSLKKHGGYIHNNMAGKLNKRKGLPTRFPMYEAGGTPEMYMGTSDYFDRQNQLAGQNAAITNLAAQGLSFVPGWGQAASVALKAGQAASNLVGQKDMYGVSPTGFQQAAAATLDPLGTINSLVQGQNPYAYKKMIGEESKLATSYGRGKTAEQQDAYTQQMKAAEGQYMAMGGYMPMYAPGGIMDPPIRNNNYRFSQKDVYISDPNEFARRQEKEQDSAMLGDISWRINQAFSKNPNYSNTGTWTNLPSRSDKDFQFAPGFVSGNGIRNLSGQRLYNFVTNRPTPLDTSYPETRDLVHAMNDYLNYGNPNILPVGHEVRAPYRSNTLLEDMGWDKPLTQGNFILPRFAYPKEHVIYQPKPPVTTKPSVVKTLKKVKPKTVTPTKQPIVEEQVVAPQVKEPIIEKQVQPESKKGYPTDWQKIDWGQYERAQADPDFEVKKVWHPALGESYYSKPKDPNYYDKKLGRTSKKYGGWLDQYASGGRITNPYSGEPNAEIEGEVVSHSNGGIQDFSHLPNHEQATSANEVNLAEGSKILSKRITDPLTGKKFATVGKKYSTSREENVLNNRLPELSNRSAKLSLMAKKKAFDDVFERHEATKVFNDAQKAENEATEEFIGMLGGMYGKGGLIKRKDGSYSPRGLWDNIRANKGSGKKPTKAMLEQERKIKAQEKAMGGYMYADGGSFNNPGFKALPGYVQAKIMNNYEAGGYVLGESYDMSEEELQELKNQGYTFDIE